MFLLSGTSPSTPIGQWNEKRLLQAESTQVVRRIEWNVRQLSITARVLEIKKIVAGVRIQISRWIGRWDGGRLERRRQQVIRIEKTS